MEKIKRFAAAALALCLLAGALAGCGKKEAASSESSALASEALQTAATPTPSPTPARNAKAAKVTSDVGLNVRAAPSTDSEILTLAAEGDLLPLLVEKASDGWYQVEYQGKTAYISADYATVVEITLEEYNQLKAASTATPEPVSSAPSATPTPVPNDDPANKGVLTPTDSSQPETSAYEDGE